MANPKIGTTLIIGGARSGKSSFAQELALKMPQPVLFVATAEAGDEEMQKRIEMHKKNRPDMWRTLEAPTLVGQKLQQEIGAMPTVIVDCITLLVNNVFNKYANSTGEPDNPSLVEQDTMAEISSLIACINMVKAKFIVVTNEVGEGLVPVNSIGRLYRDLLGKANQMLAESADQVYLMMAGLPLKIK
ncbi:bifunctional adenosylcobinamide kinase/adenosylcobinamide-phosphate guanylyltransferase [Chloroflexota bacterium]